jgi:hypothetical protein
MGRILRRAWCWIFIICFAAQTSLTQKATAEALSDASGGSTPAASGTQRVYRTLSEHIKGTICLAAGLRFDDFDWNIAGNTAGSNPNILSELAWSDIQSQQLSLGGKAQVGEHFYGRGHVNYAWIESGTVRDSDYGADDRTQEWSRSICESNDEALWDVVLGGGYPLGFDQGRWLLAPMLGGSLHKQNLRITNGYQVLSAAPPAGYQDPPPIGPLNSQLDSLYEAFWMSLWSGIDVRYRLAAKADEQPPMEWGLSLAYHFWADYQAEANWNLREDLAHPVSFEHDTGGSGISLQAEWLIRITCHLNVNLNWNYGRWQTDAGTVTVHFANGGEQFTRLNGVHWQSQSIMVGLAFRFY